MNTYTETIKILNTLDDEQLIELMHDLECLKTIKRIQRATIIHLTGNVDNMNDKEYNASIKIGELSYLIGMMHSLLDSIKGRFDSQQTKLFNEIESQIVKLFYKGE